MSAYVIETKDILYNFNVHKGIGTRGSKIGLSPYSQGRGEKHDGGGGGTCTLNVTGPEVHSEGKHSELLFPV